MDLFNNLHFVLLLYTRLTLAALGLKLNDYWREKKEKKAKERAFQALERKTKDEDAEESEEEEEDDEEEEVYASFHTDALMKRVSSYLRWHEFTRQAVRWLNGIGFTELWVCG